MGLLIVQKIPQEINSSNEISKFIFDPGVYRSSVDRFDFIFISGKRFIVIWNTTKRKIDFSTSRKHQFSGPLFTNLIQIFNK
ncbi:hypothetical protein T4A_9009 [Trichinella pseudospiralis]|uniref:Uncharacterized protein n=1 Tax=Trichinella pseudospiralis TaxID=6337 RepID=A0A0V1E2U9_TRIPS|nr:hypothetical protein T4A_9009 [Trichinella pseudospiralis]KRZ35930.1 hypothetical protein T4C_6578 [Trichinella pseudospiralis]